MESEKPIRIDVGAVLAAKLGAKARYVPRFMVRTLEKLIHQDELNTLLESNFPKRDADFCRGVLNDLNVSFAVHGVENLPASSRCIIASNHPLGGLDGMCIIAWLTEHYGKPVKVVVNDILMAVEPLSGCFVPVNTHGAQNRNSATLLDAALESDSPVVVFPAGLVSRLGDDGHVRDLKWNKMVIDKALQNRRDIVPLYFGGKNSPSFYRWARRRVRMGVRFNYEMVLLPREVLRAAGKTFDMTFGKPISWQILEGGPQARAEAARLRETVLALEAHAAQFTEKQERNKI